MMKLFKVEKKEIFLLKKKVDDEYIQINFLILYHLEFKIK